MALTGVAAVAQAQTTMFLDTFGESTVRTTSPYVPQMYLPAVGMDDSAIKFSHGGGFYKFAQTYSTNNGEEQNSNNIDNGYYAVANPNVFVQGANTPWDPSKNNYWFKAPASGDYSGQAGGATPGTPGALMAVNAGSVRNEFYRRQLSLEPGATYRVSAAFYVVNQPVNARFEAQQSQTGQILGSSAKLSFNTGVWEVKDWTFTTRSDCDTLNTNYSVSLRNLSAQNNGNDFFVDDVKLEKIASPTDPIMCANPPKNSIDAQDDHWTTTAGSTPGSLLDDDSSDGTPATPTNASITVLSNPGNMTVDGTTGAVTVPPATPAGTYEIRYQLCVVPATTPWPTCDEAVATITVGATPPPITIKASDDDFTAKPIQVGSGGSTKTGSVLGNDALNSNPNPTASDVVVGPHPDPINAPPAGITINPGDGTMDVDSSVPSGTYFVHYQICAQVAPTVCDAAIAKIVVDNSTTPKIDAQDDDFTTTTVVPGGKTPSVLGNDSLNGKTDPAPITDVTVKTDPQNPPPTGWTVNTDGTITVDPAATPGDYPVVYQICSNTTPVKCDSATATVRVGATPTTPALPPVIIATDDDLSSTPIEPGQSTSVITGNDTLGGVTVTPGTDVTVGDDPAPGNAPPAGFTIRPDGTITVDPTVTPGSYVVPYQICEAANSNNCATAKVTIVVTASSGGNNGGNNGGGNGGLPTIPTTPITPATATPVPTLQTWGLALMSLVLGAVAMRRRARG